ncbi:MAG: KEOPS complex subunit Cgi121 [Candidatus Hermodarchaeota archaeon]|jgi:tRNA threonylcarbamoyladenosine modification (KEOPS) complex Cgi121 subunit|nr:KEOPS complex subunit Cgi121 [Candidatus Hermodarchaeota archaeon]
MTSLLLQETRIGPMLHQIGIFGGTLAKSGASSDLVELAQRIAFDHDATFQLVNADTVASPKHLLFAAIHALTAFHRGTQRASTLAMELLRFAAAQRQISQALNLLGITESTLHLGGVIIGESITKIQNVHQDFLHLANVTDDPVVLEINSKKKEQAIQDAYQITARELDAIMISESSEDRIAALQKLVYDRCALLAISR